MPANTEAIRDRLTRAEKKIEALQKTKTEERDCASRHERSNAVMNAMRSKQDVDHERMIALTGIDGKNGRVAAVEKKADDNAEKITIGKERAWKIVVVLAVLSVTSGSATAFVFNWLRP